MNDTATTLPEDVRQHLDNPDAEIERVTKFTCNECGFSDYDVSFADGSNVFIDDDGDTRTVMVGLDDDYSHFYHLRPEETTHWICDTCEYNLLEDMEPVYTVQPDGNHGRVHFHNGYVATEGPWSYPTIDDWDDPLKTARDTLLSGEGVATFHEAELTRVSIRRDFAQTLIDGDVRGVYAIVDSPDVYVPDAFVHTLEYLHDLFELGAVPADH